MRHRTTIALALTMILLASTIAPAFAAEKVRQDPHLRAEAVYRGILPKRQATVDDTVKAIKERGFTRISVSGKGSQIRVGVSDYWKPFGKRTRFGVRYPVNALVIVKLVTPPKPPVATPPTNGKLAVAYWLDYWCDANGIKGAEKAWLIVKGLAVALAESGYDRFCVTGGHYGIYQTTIDWERTCPYHDTRAEKIAHLQEVRYSTKLFVRTYKQGGVEECQEQWVTW